MLIPLKPYSSKVPTANYALKSDVCLCLCLHVVLECMLPCPLAGYVCMLTVVYDTEWYIMIP